MTSPTAMSAGTTAVRRAADGGLWALPRHVATCRGDYHEKVIPCTWYPWGERGEGSKRDMEVFPTQGHFREYSEIGVREVADGLPVSTAMQTKSWKAKSQEPELRFRSEPELRFRNALQDIDLGPASAKLLECACLSLNPNPYPDVLSAGSVTTRGKIYYYCTTAAVRTKQTLKKLCTTHSSCRTKLLCLDQ